MVFNFRQREASAVVRSYRPRKVSFKFWSRDWSLFFDEQRREARAPLHFTRETDHSVAHSLSLGNELVVHTGSGVVRELRTQAEQVENDSKLKMMGNHDVRVRMQHFFGPQRRSQSSGLQLRKHLLLLVDRSHTTHVVACLVALCGRSFARCRMYVDEHNYDTARQRHTVLPWVGIPLQPTVRLVSRTAFVTAVSRENSLLCCCSSVGEVVPPVGGMPPQP